MRSTRPTPSHEANEPIQRSCHLSVTLPADLYDALAQMAAGNERTIAGEVRMLIKQKAEEADLFWDET